MGHFVYGYKVPHFLLIGENKKEKERVAYV